MRVAQICATDGHACGISLFAEALEHQLRGRGVYVTTSSRLPDIGRFALVVLQYHNELWSDADAAAIGLLSDVPAVLFAHSEVPPVVSMAFDGTIAFCAGMAAATGPSYILAHPAWTPPRLEDRATLKREFRLPADRRVIGSCGFLKFERQYVEIVEAILPTVDRCGWFIDLMTSPWRLESPRLLERLAVIQHSHPNLLCVGHAFLDTPTLNRRLQACDLLWCWTAAPSSPYASGVASDQYASGTRILAADKVQHHHILGLPNVVSGSESFEAFVATMLAELEGPPANRHNPSPVSWDHCARGLVTFFQDVSKSTQRRRPERRDAMYADD